MVKYKKQNILIVDDSEINMEFLTESLCSLYSVEGAMSFKEVKSMLEINKPDLILLDIVMPETDGFGVFDFIKGNEEFKEIPIIFITSNDDVESKVKAFNLGASDYITKPFNIKELKIRIRKHLEDANSILRLKSDLDEKNRELANICENVYNNFINLVFIRNKETGNHLIRTEKYMQLLIKKYKEIYNEELDLDEFVVARASALHDIGKIAISDSILLKSGRFTGEEFEIMKNHTSMGREILDFKNSKEFNNTLFNYARDIALYHHERWGGGGYPMGIKGEKIPVVARFMSICDVYDALVSKRIYKSEFSHDEATKFILQDKINQFDPRMIKVFSYIEEDFKKIAKRYKDG